MSHALTLLTHQRPVYLKETLSALARCYGVADWRVALVMDRPDTLTRGMCRETPWETVEVDLRNGADEPYSRVSRVTLMALSLGFATADYVVHLEEDCVPSRDFLTWHAKMAERYRDDKRVFTVNAWDRRPQARSGDYRSPWFTPWGWATWHDRFLEMRESWDFTFWDRHLNERLRGDRLGVFPSVSKVHNIGAYGGVTGQPVAMVA